MVWKKIDNYDQSVDVWMSIQNNSLIPFSKVTIQFTTASAPTEGKGFVLTGPNQWSQRVPAGTNVFYKEEDGGIITWWSREIEKLVNYDIPTQEELVNKLTSKSVVCPEGSFISIQNLSEAPIYYNFLGKGNFVLTQYQGMSYTFAKDSVINFSADGTPSLQYMIGQSPNVTMLSEATQNLLDEINAKIEGLMENAATKEELDIVKRRTYFGKWSPFVSVTGTKGKVMASPKFMKDKDFKSEFVTDKSILDISLELSYSRFDKDQNKNISEKASVKITVIVQPSGEGHQFSGYYCDTPWFSQNISGLELYRDNTNGQLRFNINLKSDVANYTMVASIRQDDTKFVESNIAGFLNEKICMYSIDKDNSDIHFTDESFYLGIMESWDYALEKHITKINAIKKTESTTDTEMIQEFTSTETPEFKFKFAQDMEGTSGIVTFEIPVSVGVNKVVGVNIKTVDVSKSDNVYLDLIVMGDGRQTKVNKNTVDVFTLPMWNHVKFGYSYIADKLSKITQDNASNYYIEVVYS